jgi:broad specificity phosphatase PhoE
MIQTPAMSRRRIVLVRHGKPDIEEGVPSADWRLSAAGHETAAALAEKLRGFDFAGIASSPEPKAAGTAQAIAQRLGLTVEIDAGLAEHARRSVGFLPREEIEASIARLFAKPDTLEFGDETANQCLARFQAALDRQVAKGARDVFVATHGTVLSIYVSLTFGIDAMPFWRALGLPTAIVLENGKIRTVDP